MINLIPAHTKDVAYLHRLVSERNAWFVKLRYGAVLMLTAFFAYLMLFKAGNAGGRHYFGILAIVAIVLAYNVVLDLHSRRFRTEPEDSRFHPMQIALAQTICDLTALIALSYFTGLLYSPFSLFFVFHAIIASMILPGRVVYVMFIAVMLIFSSLVFLSNNGILPSYDIFLGRIERVESTDELLVYLSAYWMMLLFSVDFANSLASAHFRREQELNEAMRRIEIAELEKQKYVMAVVHEVKSPIAAITSYLNILLAGIAGELTGKTKEIVTKCKVRADDAIGLTNDILDISRVRLLEQIKKEPLYLEKIIAEIFDSIRSKAEVKNISVEFLEDTDRCQLVSADKRLMELVISNLMSNAVKYTPSGGRVTLRLAERDEKLVISVSDSGIGIPEDEMGKLFGEFYRASNAKKMNIEGTGLGLATVKQAVEKHGGTVSIISPGLLAENGSPGTTVTVEIPLNNS